MESVSGGWSHFHGYRQSHDSSQPSSSKGLCGMSQATNRKSGPSGPLKVRRLPVTFRSDFRRVITRFFNPGGEARIGHVIDRVRALSDEQVDRLLDEVFLKFRTRHGNIASVLDENYRDGPGNRRPAGRLLAQSPHADRGLLDRGVLDRIRGALQSVDRAASQPAQHSRRRGADHHESAGDRRGARLLHRLPHRRHLFRPPDPNRPLQPLHQARPGRAGQAIRKASCSAASSRTSTSTRR